MYEPVGEIPQPGKFGSWRGRVQQLFPRHEDARNPPHCVRNVSTITKRPKQARKERRSSFISSGRFAFFILRYRADVVWVFVALLHALQEMVTIRVRLDLKLVAMES